MEAVGAASAIIGVAQLGLQFSQVLVTVIGDYRDAAKNINRLRDEIHLASICLQQLGDLATHGVLRDYAILEATNLRERCQAVFWEIRSTIRRGDTPLHPVNITKDQIDVSYFTSFKWALWTKKQLEEPRQELDRLKDSMTLCFVSHMAMTANTDLERAKYASQIPGIKRSLVWSEKKPDIDHFRARLEAAGLSPETIAAILNDKDLPVSRPTDSDPKPGQAPTALSPGHNACEQASETFRVWSMDPLSKTSQLPLTQAWTARFLDQYRVGSEDLWKTHSKLHPWFKNELSNIFNEQAADSKYTWSLVSIQSTYRNVFSRRMPQSVQVIFKGLPKATRTPSRRQGSSVSQTITYELSEPMHTTRIHHTPLPHPNLADPQPEIVSIDSIKSITRQTDEEIIARQLALYE